jgi:hypothetical protein
MNDAVWPSLRSTGRSLRDREEMLRDQLAQT